MKFDLPHLYFRLKDFDPIDVRYHKCAPLMPLENIICCSIYAFFDVFLFSSYSNAYFRRKLFPADRKRKASLQIIKQDEQDEHQWFWARNSKNKAEILKYSCFQIVVLFLTYAINARVYANLYSSQLRDKGSYSCRVKSDSIESRVDQKLLILAPSEITVLDKDKNRYVKLLDFSCCNSFENGKRSPG